MRCAVSLVLFLFVAPSAALADDGRAALAPTGKLRIGVYPGSPSSMVRDDRTGETRGVAVDVGRDLATRLGIASEIVVYQRIAEVLDALKAGAVDFTVTNATPARAQNVDFGPDLLTVELGYLVGPDSKIANVADLQGAGVRIGVTKGSTSEKTLPALLPKAAFTPAANLKEAAEMLRNGQIDAYATNKAVLFEMADQVAGSKMLDGRWGAEHMAAAIPKGRSAGIDFLKKFSDDERASGAVAKAASRAGLRGVVTESRN